GSAARSTWPARSTQASTTRSQSAMPTSRARPRCCTSPRTSGGCGSISTRPTTSQLVSDTSRGVRHLLEEIGPLGLGTAPLGGLYETVDDETALAVVDRAWELGVHYFDTAPYYG